MYHFIINPNAGSGRGWKVWRAIAGYMDRHNIEYEAVLTNGIGEARDAARELTKEDGKPCFLSAVPNERSIKIIMGRSMDYIRISELKLRMQSEK